MEIRNLRIGRYTMIWTAIFLAAVCLLTACGKEKKISYGKEPGAATGTVDFMKDKSDINIDNILSPIGADIDYTSLLELVKGDEDYSVQVNASKVRNDKPGTYNVEYKFTYGNDIYTDNIKVTITDDETITTGTPNQDQVILEETQNPPDKNEPAEETTTNKELILDSNQSWQDFDIPNAVIELLSGDVVTISCSASKYIVATSTKVSKIKRNGHHYKVSKLVIKFNTGAEQVLETIEKKID